MRTFFEHLEDKKNSVLLNQIVEVAEKLDVDPIDYLIEALKGTEYQGVLSEAMNEWWGGRMAAGIRGALGGARQRWGAATAEYEREQQLERRRERYQEMMDRVNYAAQILQGVVHPRSDMWRFFQKALDELNRKMGELEGTPMERPAPAAETPPAEEPAAEPRRMPLGVGPAHEYPRG